MAPIHLDEIKLITKIHFYDCECDIKPIILYESRPRGRWRGFFGICRWSRSVNFIWNSYFTNHWKVLNHFKKLVKYTLLSCFSFFSLLIVIRVARDQRSFRWYSQCWQSRVLNENSGPGAEFVFAYLYSAGLDPYIIWLVGWFELIVYLFICFIYLFLFSERRKQSCHFLMRFQSEHWNQLCLLPQLEAEVIYYCGIDYIFILFHILSKRSLKSIVSCKNAIFFL